MSSSTGGSGPRGARFGAEFSRAAAQPQLRRAFGRTSKRRWRPSCPSPGATPTPRAEADRRTGRDRARERGEEDGLALFAGVDLATGASGSAIAPGLAARALETLRDGMPPRIVVLHGLAGRRRDDPGAPGLPARPAPCRASVPRPCPQAPAIPRVGGLGSRRRAVEARPVAAAAVAGPTIPAPWERRDRRGHPTARGPAQALRGRPGRTCCATPAKTR